MHRRKVFEFWNIIAVVIFFLFVLFLIYPIGGLLREAAYVDGSLSFDAFARFFAKNYYYSTVFNSCGSHVVLPFARHTLRVFLYVFQFARQEISLCDEPALYDVRAFYRRIRMDFAYGQ